MAEERFPFETLEIAGKPGVYACAKHPKTETRLRCGRCEKPICPKCTVYGPTGARCRECLSNRDSHVYQVSPRVLAISFGAAVLAGVLGALLVKIAGVLWLLALLYAPALGPVLARFIIKISGGKRGRKVAIPTMLGVAIGALAGGVAFGTLTSLVFWPMLGFALFGIWRELS